MVSAEPLLFSTGNSFSAWFAKQHTGRLTDHKVVGVSHRFGCPTLRVREFLAGLSA